MMGFLLVCFCLVCMFVFAITQGKKALGYWKHGSECPVSLLAGIPSLFLQILFAFGGKTHFFA